MQGRASARVGALFPLCAAAAGGRGFAYIAVMTRGKRRLAWRIAASVAAGVVMTVGVAWGAAIWLPIDSTPRQVAVDVRWPPAVRDGGGVWPGQADAYLRSRRLARTYERWTAESDTTHFELGRFSSGWPMRALASHDFITRSRTSGVSGSHFDGLLTPRWARSLLPAYIPGKIPVRVRWLGFVFNTVLCGAIFLLLWTAPGFARSRIRASRGRCQRCGYDLSGSAGKPCPECGS
jgi:hypothetical protein